MRREAPHVQADPSSTSKFYEGPRILDDNPVDENGLESLGIPRRVDDKRKVPKSSEK